MGEWKCSGPLAGVEGTDMGTVSGILRIDGVAISIPFNIVEIFDFFATWYPKYS